ncbi:MAG: CDP-alcohol phosphatidyltransferase family protein [Candidatus Diapherotrites archaeon]
MLSKFIPTEMRKNLAKKIVSLFAWTGVTPNMLTLLAIPLAIIAAYFIAAGQFTFALIFIFLSVFIDALDGSLAELTNKKTPFGNYLDAMTDKIVESIIYIGFAFIQPIAAILALSGTMLIAYAKPRAALVVETDNRDWPAIGERGDRLIVLIVGMLVAVFVPEIYGFSTILITLALVAAITWIGAVQRLLYGKALIEEGEKKGKILNYLKKK